jgi:hypothetical protein
MPDFAIVSMQEAKLWTTPGRKGKYLHQYASYIQQLPKGQAGKLHSGEKENPLTIRRRLASAANALGIPLVIKRSGQDVYFWREDGGEEQVRSTRRYTRRISTGSPGSLIPPNILITEPEEAGEQGVAEEETTPLDQSFTAIE